MAKAASRTKLSARKQNKPSSNQSKPDPHIDPVASGQLPKAAPDTTEAEQAPRPFDPRHLLTMTEDESLQVYQARCMLKLLEDMALFGEREITMSRESLVVMMAAIRQKLAFSARLIAMDDEDLFDDQE